MRKLDEFLAVFQPVEEEPAEGDRHKISKFLRMFREETQKDAEGGNRLPSSSVSLRMSRTSSLLCEGRKKRLKKTKLGFFGLS